MSKIKFYTINEVEKKAVFNTIANQKGMTPAAVEKDWWVSRTLQIIFQMDIAKHLVFKGGTSLSKAWKLIHRFSEDIDIAIDKQFFDVYDEDITKKQLTKLRKEAGKYTTGTFFEQLKAEFHHQGFNDLDFKIIEAKDSDQDPRVLEIYYPNVIQTNSHYILPRVQIEISCRSLREPFSSKFFGSLVDEVYEGRNFVEPLFSVPTVNPERTFLEKLFLLHEEFHRPKDKIRVDRLSRHLYDIFQLSKTNFAEIAFNDKNLYQTIVLHRYNYAKVGNVDYNLHHPKMLNPTPIPSVMKEWKEDYAKMKEDMIYETTKPSFEELIENLSELMQKLKKVSWEFDIKFEN